MSRSNRFTTPEPPCVWVQAGVLSFRPCHRDFDCDGCEIFQAIRGPEREPQASEASERTGVPSNHAGESRAPGLPQAVEAAVAAYLGNLTEGCDLHLDLPYSPGHFWLRNSADDDLFLGFDCQTLRVLFPVEDIILPRVGAWIERGEPMGWIQRGHLVLPLSAPISGEVMETNTAVLTEVREHGFPLARDRWLLRLKPHEPLGDIPELIRGQATLSWYQRKLNLIREYLLDAMDPGVEAGATQNDGGALNRNLEEVLGSETYRDLLTRLFHES